MNRAIIHGSVWLRWTVLGIFLVSGRAAGDPANRPGDEPSTTAVGAWLLAHAPLFPELERVCFEVPASVVERAILAQVRDGAPADVYADAPNAAVPGHWDLRLAVNGGQIETRVELSGTVFRASPRRPVYIALFPAHTVFDDLRLNGRPIAPARTRDCWMRASVTNAGPFRITASLSVQAVADGLQRSLRFQPLGFAYASVRFDSKEAWEVRIADGAGRLLGTDDAGTHGLLAAPSRSAFSVVWKKPEAERALCGMASVRPSFAWAIGEKTLLANGILDVEILGGAQDRVGLMLPDGADRIQLSGSDVRLVEREGSRLTVRFRGPVRGRTAMRLSYECPRGRGNLVTCPEIEVPGGRLDSGGWLLVANDAEGELLEQQAQGFEPRASVEAPAEVRGLLPGKPLFTYARTGHRCRAVFDAVSTSPFPLVDTIADRADALLSLQDSGDEMARIRYTVRNNRKQFLRMILPEGARLLWVAVERKPVSPTQVGREVWIPLLKSVRTLEGLISFPVEILYVRSGSPVAGDGRRAMPLPELTEIPTALTRVTILGPSGLRISDTRGPLRPVAQFQTGDGFVYGRGIEMAPGHSMQTALQATAGASLLSWKYYESGYDAYRSGNIEDAEELLAKAVDPAADGNGPSEARTLLSTIRAGRGEGVSSGSREDRARLTNVKKEIGRDAAPFAARQDALVLNAARMIESGNEEIGAQLLDEAEVVGKKLVQRGESSREQKGVFEQFREKLSIVRERKRENEVLQASLANLQQESIRLMASAKAGDAGASQARTYARALSQAAADNQVAPDELQPVALGLAAPNAAPKADLDDKMVALQFQDAPDTVGAASTPASQRGGRSLAGENARLRRQVAALSQAVSQTMNAGGGRSAGFSRRAADDTAIQEAHRLLAKAASDAEGIGRQAESDARTVDAWNDQKLRGRLDPLRRAADAYGNLYGAVDPTIARDVQTLQARIADAEKRIARSAEGRKQAEQVAVDLGALLPAGSVADQQALAQFLHLNVIPQVRNDQVQFQIANGRLSIRNEGDNATVLGEAVERLQRNRGLAVPVQGADLEGLRVAADPALRAWFTLRTQDGLSLAVLDEAQFRLASERAGRVRDLDRRDVIVGTVNRAAGQRFRLIRSGRNENVFEISGMEVPVPLNRCVAIDNGDSVSVFRADAAVPWTRLAERPPAVRTTRSSPEVPMTGVPFRFEKTLLAAGESPGFEITYQYKPKGERR